METKTCCSCNHEKLMTDFGIVDKIYRLNDCKTCWRERNNNIINSNPEKFFKTILDGAKTNSKQINL